MWIWQDPRSNASTTNFFHIKINSVATGKVKTYFCRRGTSSKVGHRKFQKVLVDIIIHGTVRLQWIDKIIWIRGQCTSCVTKVVIQSVAVPIHNMAPTIMDDVGVWHSVTIQQIHRIMEEQWCGEFINIIFLGGTLSNGKVRSVPSYSGSIYKIEHGCR